MLFVALSLVVPVFVRCFIFLQLHRQHVDVSRNNINLISCDGMNRLESLLASCNNLTSIHGLDGCNNLIYLDLSHNHITKLHNLPSFKSLRHLRYAIRDVTSSVIT